MKTRALLAILALAAVGALAAWLAMRGGSPREVPFARALRETLVSTLTTNAKIEPLESAAARAEIEGPLTRVPVERGQRVAKGAPLASLDVSAFERDLTEAEAAIAQARADLKVYDRGGAAAALAEIEGGLRKARLELEIARREQASLERLAAKNAVPRQEVETARDRVRQLEVEIDSLEKKKPALLPEGGRTAVLARLTQAEASKALARLRMEKGTIRAPMSGVVYNVEVKAGAFVQPGDLVAEIGRIDVVRAVLYVDEPELGRVAVGMPVTITWDAAPDAKWQGAVEKLPAQVAAYGTRQVGEVVCRIRNEDGRLLPGSNVNAEVRSEAAADAITIPKEAVRRTGDRTGVFVQTGEILEWREVKLGVSSVTRVQVVEGLKEGEGVALTVDGAALRPGDRVTPVFAQ